MIISNKYKFIFIKTPKTGGSSVEFYLSQFCEKEKDIITELLPEEEKKRMESKIPTGYNFEYQLFSLRLKNLMKLKIFSKKNIYDHMSLNELIKSKIVNNIKEYFIFAFIRNPYDWIVSYFWWHIFSHKKFTIPQLKNLDKNEIQISFKSFLKLHCTGFFNWQKNIIQSDTQNINIFKYENFNKSIYEIKKKLLLKGEKFNLSQINLKKFNFNKEIKLDNNDIIIINESARYFFDDFSYSKEVPDKYL